ncbi:ATP-binding protein [Pasteurella bettyae]|uniref:histidine kinase n=1 Tax=Pasteurella bettyae CCUG 2042 TaxID=1095749 RepID=I3DFH3_9PAST|nr:ATP-binding protein [Pasteurella bettyae]EIJ70466.1 GHKL domain protein [Pasteurella bettyae CCUG 2042]SUB21027.1 phosphoglycerate transport system sensor protein PgtB [Pasteurella bettyae]
MKKTSISRILKNAFSISLFFTLVIGLVSLFSWYQQHKQVNYILEDYFPKTNLALKLEDNVNTLLSELERFSELKNNVIRQSMFKQLNKQLEEIEQDVVILSTTDDKETILKNIEALKALIIQINQNISDNLLIEQKKQELITKIQWLHDDFNNEIVALGQELNWQQINLASQPYVIHQERHIASNLSSELQAISQLKNIEEQIKNEITQFLYSLDEKTISIQYQNLLELVSNIYHSEPIKVTNASLTTLQQMIDMLVQTTTPTEEVGRLVSNITHYQRSQIDVSFQQSQILQSIRQIIDNILMQTKEKVSALNQDMQFQTEISGTIIGIALLVSLIFIWLFNYFYLQQHLTKRFEDLIESVKLLNQGKEDLLIKVSGNDEISEINHLLKHHTEIVKERHAIASDLRDTQNELIQTAKLAVVGQTMTSLAHEINQPLNAISIYLFSLKKILKAQNLPQAELYTEKISKLAERIAHIVKGLRQFTKRHGQTDLLQPIQLNDVIQEAWDLLELRHQPVQAKLLVEGMASVNGSKVLLEQVFVNLFTNALEACKVQPKIHIRILINDDKTHVYLEDNGTGWQLDNADKLLQPFYSNKEVGLGLGLTICQRIMNQFNGQLYIASSMQKSAVVILEFPSLTMNVVENKDES